MIPKLLRATKTNSATPCLLLLKWNSIFVSFFLTPQAWMHPLQNIYVARSLVNSILKLGIVSSSINDSPIIFPSDKCSRAERLLYVLVYCRFFVQEVLRPLSSSLGRTSEPFSNNKLWSSATSTNPVFVVTLKIPLVV